MSRLNTVIILLGISYLVIQLAFSDFSLSTSSHGEFLLVDKNVNTLRLTQDRPLEFSFKSVDDNLGIVAISFIEDQTINLSNAQVQLYEEGSHKPISINNYSLKQFVLVDPHPFGFETIKNSAGKSYVLKIFLEEGSEGTILVNISKPLITKYENELTDVISVLSLIAKKISYSAKYQQLLIRMTLFILCILVLQALGSIRLKHALNEHNFGFVHELGSQLSTDKALILVSAIIIFDALFIPSTVWIVYIGATIYLLISNILNSRNSSFIYYYAIVNSIFMMVMFVLGQESAANTVATWVYHIVIVALITGYYEKAK